MSEQHRKQLGFGAIEILLLVIVVGVLGATGWYAFSSKHKTDQILDQAAKISQGTPIKAIPSRTSSQGYLAIKEWKVKFRIPIDLKSMKYSFDNNLGPDSVRLDSQDLSTLAGNSKWCPNDGLLGLLTRSKQLFDQSQPDASKPFKKIGDYYFYYGGPQVGCYPSSYNPAGDLTTYPSSTLQHEASAQLESLLAQTLTTSQ